MDALLFIDTEFTDLSNPRLLSLGMVTSGGRELYLELDRSDTGNADVFAAASLFVHDGVLDQWGRVPGAAVSSIEMGRRAGGWMLGLAAEAGQPLILAFDYRADYELLQQSLERAEIWSEVRRVVRPANINDITGIAEGQLAAEAQYERLRPRALARHHALADALAMRAAYLAVTQPQGSPQ